jgi:hypothetical protein
MKLILTHQPFGEDGPRVLGSGFNTERFKSDDLAIIVFQNGFDHMRDGCTVKLMGLAGFFVGVPALEGNYISLFQGINIRHYFRNNNISGIEVNLHMSIRLGLTHRVTQYDKEFISQNVTVILVYGGNSNKSKYHRYNRKRNNDPGGYLGYYIKNFFCHNKLSANLSHLLLTLP